MSSSEKPQNEIYSEPAWNHGFASNIPRPPNTDTESRILGTIRKNEQKQQNVNANIVNNDVNNSDSSSQPPSGNPSANQIAPQQSLTLPQVHSQLNAEAKEFVPRSQGHTPDSGSKQESSQDESFSLSVTAAEFVPRTNDGFYTNADSSFPQRLPFHPGANNMMDNFNNLSIQGPYDSYRRFEMPTEMSGGSILSRFNNSLNVLNLSPGNMEEYLRPVCEMIQNNAESTGIVNDVVESLFEQSLQEPNFRYTGARICQYLNMNLKENPYFSGFLRLFINRCQKEYSLRNELKNGGAYDQERLRGLSMFMAEVFLNVETDTDDGSVKQLPKILIDLVSTLLTEPSDLDVKCSCQLLKLSGALIENIVKHSPEDCAKFEEIFMQLVALQGSSELTENVTFLIGSVLKLKETDWNRSTSSPPRKSMYTYTQDVNHFKAAEPVFYNQRGAPCSRVEAGLPEDDDDDDDDAYVLNDEEEAAFLEWEAEKAQLLSQNAWGNSDTGYEYQIDDGSDGEMGDEMEAAYEEFLQKQNAMPVYSNSATNSVEQQLPPAVVHMFHQPPPNRSHHQDFQGFPQQHHQQQHQQYMMQANSQQQPPHVVRPSAQQNQPPQQQQQQQQQGQQPYPQQYPRKDRFHFHR